MKNFLPLTLALGALLPATAALAQAPVKFGQVDPKDLTAAPFAGDSAAAAVVLCDYGTARFEYINSDFQLVSERTTRIKILKKAGYEAATVKIPLYHQGESAEKVSSLVFKQMYRNLLALHANFSPRGKRCVFLSLSFCFPF